MCSHHDMADAMLLARVVLERFRLQGPAFWPAVENVADVPGRCVKQPIKVTLFAHEMEPELPLRAEILKYNPVRGGHMHLFDDPNAKPDPFCSMEITVGGREVFSLFWGEGCCHAWMSPGPWRSDIIRWATKHQDPIRLANLNLVRLLLVGSAAMSICRIAILGLQRCALMTTVLVENSKYGFRGPKVSQTRFGRFLFRRMRSPNITTSACCM